MRLFERNRTKARRQEWGSSEECERKKGWTDFASQRKIWSDIVIIIICKCVVERGAAVDSTNPILNMKRVRVVCSVRNRVDVTYTVYTLYTRQVNILRDR